MKAYFLLVLANFNNTLKAYKKVKPPFTRVVYYFNLQISDCNLQQCAVKIMLNGNAIIKTCNFLSCESQWSLHAIIITGTFHDLKTYAKYRTLQKAWTVEEE